DDEGRPFVQAVDVVGQMLCDRLVLVGPEPPVILRSREKRSGRPLAHELVELADVLVGLTRGDPEHRGRGPSRRYGDGDHTHAIVRSLRYWVALELSVLTCNACDRVGRCVIL